MDGAKIITDTTDNLKGCGRLAFHLGRKIFERRSGPNGNENPGKSRILAE